jgi:hypothetical protein
MGLLSRRDNFVPSNCLIYVIHKDENFIRENKLSYLVRTVLMSERTLSTHLSTVH